MPSIVCIVEGHGDVQGLPALLRNYLHSRNMYHLSVQQGIRTSKGKFVNDADARRRLLKLAAAQVDVGGIVLVLMDADEDCPAQLGPVLAQEAHTVIGHVNSAVVLAMREFEAWFIAGAESLNPDVVAPENPEQIGDAKGWVSHQILVGGHYSEVLDQPRLAARIDVSVARTRSSSLDKLLREIEKIWP